MKLARDHACSNSLGSKGGSAVLINPQNQGVIEITIHYNKVEEQHKQLNQVYFNFSLK